MHNSNDTTFNEAAKLLETNSGKLRGHWLTVFVKESADSQACMLHINHEATDEMIFAMVTELLQNPRYAAVARQAVKDTIDHLFADQTIGKPVGSA